jgi:pimeloyl-ACP methyl ester carboxylesterase
MNFVLPGMGADHRMYDSPAWHSVEGTRFLDWPDVLGGFSIEALADRVVRAEGIADGDTVIGASFGGIVGCEIARRRTLKALVLIGSAISPAELSGFLTAVRPLINLAPISFIQAVAGKIPTDLADMFSKARAEFIRGSCRAIFKWPGLSEATILPVRIHGRHDRVIPLPARVDCILDGGHLIAMTHASECVESLRNRRII